MLGTGKRSKALPSLGGGLKWWVIESQRRNTRKNRLFRIFHAVVAQNERDAIENLKASGAKLDRSLMNLAIKKEEIIDEFDWEPASELVRHISVSCVTTEEDVAALDPPLLEMLIEHEFFLGELEDDPQSSFGGGVYDWPGA